MLLRLLLRFRLPPLLRDGFFFSVFPRDRAPVVERAPSPGPMDPERELERCMLAGTACTGVASMMELPRWLASHSSVNLAGRMATGAMSGVERSARCDAGRGAELARVLERVWSAAAVSGA